MDPSTLQDRTNLLHRTSATRGRTSRDITADWLIFESNAGIVAWGSVRASREGAIDAITVILSSAVEEDDDGQGFYAASFQTHHHMIADDRVTFVLNGGSLCPGQAVNTIYGTVLCFKDDEVVARFDRTLTISPG